MTPTLPEHAVHRSTSHRAPRSRLMARRGRLPRSHEDIGRLMNGSRSSLLVRGMPGPEHAHDVHLIVRRLAADFPSRRGRELIALEGGARTCSA